MSNFVVSGPKFTERFSPNAGGIAVDHVFPILDISISSGDIRDRSSKLSEVDPNFARFSP